MNKCTPEDCEKLYTSRDKWNISILAGVVFLIVASPLMYRVLDTILKPIGLPIVSDGTPTVLGLILTAIVYTLITRLLMN